jgi:signal transduction histidine kinase
MRGITKGHMDHRSSRTYWDIARWRQLSRFVLPVVSIMLLIGAMFIIIAYSDSRDVVDRGQAQEAERAARIADAIEDVITRRTDEARAWIQAHEQVFTADDQGAAAQKLLDARAADETSDAIAGRLLITENGAVIARGEQVLGNLAAGGIEDELRVLARTSIARDEIKVSGKLRLGDREVFAIAAPISNGAASAERALVTVYDIDATSIGAFLSGDSDTGEPLALTDERNRRLLGTPIRDGAEIVRRDVGAIGWTVSLQREDSRTLMPLWAYPLFALLLVLLAAAYGWQASRQRALSRSSDERARQIRTLYELASRVLHVRTTRSQAELLAHATLDLVGIDGARVRFAAERDFAGIVAGTCTPDLRSYRVAITGPRGPIGELVAYQRRIPLDVDQRSALQTAATLVGAAMHTVDSLESERAVAQELQQIDELRSNLMATVAHELRSPITAIKGVLDLLSMQPDLTERTSQYVDVASERTDRLVALIQDLFDSSLLETGQLDIAPQRVRADDLLDSALGALATAHPGQLLLSATSGLDMTVDPVRFDQLVNNLVTNSFRHGAPPIEVTIRECNGGVHIVVTDDGPGIDPSDRERIFGKFWQGSTGHARLVEGAGLGLSLVQGLVLLHGGTIEIDNVRPDGSGARFTVFLPDETPDTTRHQRSAPDPDLEVLRRII